MFNKILHFIFLSFSVLVLSAVHSDAFANEGMHISVDGQRFDTQGFFDLEYLGFEKDKVNFNKGWLGIFMENAEGKGILVKEITRGSPAAEAGLKAGDIITKINDEFIPGTDDLNLIQFKKTIEAIGAGGTPALTVSRGNVEMVFTPRLFGKLLKNVSEPVTSFIPKTNPVLTKEAEDTHSSFPPCEGEGGWVENPSSNKEVKKPFNSKHTGMSFIEFAIKNERYRDMLDATLQRIGEEVYVREGFQSNDEVNPFRLSIINYFMLHPFDTPKIGQAIINTFSRKDLCDQLWYAAELLDVKMDLLNVGLETTPPSPPCEGEKMETTDSLQGQLQIVIDSLPSCESLVKGAFSALSQEEVEFLYQNAHKIWLPEEKIETQDLARILALSQKVNLTKLFEAASVLLSRLAPVCLPPADFARDSEHGMAAMKKIHPDAMQVKLLPFHLPVSLQCANQQEIPDEASMRGKSSESVAVVEETKTGDLPINRNPSPVGRGLGGGGAEALQDFAGDILFVQDTSIGKIVVGGTGTSYYYADATVIIDLGGNDYYFNNAGSSCKDRPVSICVDLSGDDIYHTDAPFSQGTGRFGIGILIDTRGNDRYLGKDFSQGSCLFGVGLLLDNDGNDFYSGRADNQGAGFFGAGMLSDLAGNDVYFSRQFAQGVGFTKGFGALMDSGGNDFYFAGGGYPDFRDPERSFQSMSQGMGMGIRPEDTVVGASGGIGMLIDQKGTDQYHGDYFSQGSGYYYSLGLLYDNDGSDKYDAGRYAQGAGIHSAIGLMTDTSGDDTYACTFGVSQGCGHDTGIGFLVDDQGNDTYLSKTTSQGVGLEKGIGVLADFYGDDVYQANGNSQGISSPSKTEDIFGMGILIDNQGNQDIFHCPVAENQLFYRTDGGLVLNK
ncbi:MAG: PDZ domain-containing protein [Candidatus Brocadia sp.]|nr:PDZ domain-containing protein [Candidatus Brocadia sp.]